MIELFKKYAKEMEAKEPITIGVIEDKELKAVIVFYSYNSGAIKLKETKVFTIENKTELSDDTFAKKQIELFAYDFIGSIMGECWKVLKAFSDEAKQEVKRYE